MRTEEEIRERIELWRRFQDETDPYNDKLPSEKIRKQLGVEEHLLDDYFYDNQAISWIIRELKWVLEEGEQS